MNKACLEVVTVRTGIADEQKDTIKTSLKVKILLFAVYLYWLLGFLLHRHPPIFFIGRASKIERLFKHHCIRFIIQVVETISDYFS